MADLRNVQAATFHGRVYTDTAFDAAEALTLNLETYSVFDLTLVGVGGNPLTWDGVRAGGIYDVLFFLRQPTGSDALKPTNAASTNSAGTTLIFHTNGTGGSNAAWPTLSTTDGVVDFFRWVSPNGVDFFLTSISLALDE
jgi:hypothetical protein